MHACPDILTLCGVPLCTIQGATLDIQVATLDRRSQKLNYQSEIDHNEMMLCRPST